MRPIHPVETPLGTVVDWLDESLLEQRGPVGRVSLTGVTISGGRPPGGAAGEDVTGQPSSFGLKPSAAITTNPFLGRLADGYHRALGTSSEGWPT